MDFISRLKLVIQNSGLSQKDFAERIGVSPSRITEVFSGRTKSLSGDALAAISIKFSVNINWLLTGAGEIFLPQREQSSVADNSINYTVLDGNAGTYPQITMVEQISRTGWFRNLSPHKREIVAAVDEIQDADYIRLTSENMLNKVQADRARAAEKARLRQKGETG